MFDLDPRAIPHLTHGHLVFWTSTTNRFSISPVDGTTPARDRHILDEDFNPVGFTVLNDLQAGEAQSANSRSGCAGTEIIVIAEAHGSLLSPSTSDEFPCYMVMLIETDARTGIASRRGLGSLAKASWIASEPSLRLVCLG